MPILYFVRYQWIPPDLNIIEENNKDCTNCYNCICCYECDKCYFCFYSYDLYDQYNCVFN